MGKLIFEKKIISILAENLNSGLSYLITTVHCIATGKKEKQNMFSIAVFENINLAR